MSLEFEKYSDKSYVVRGEVLNDIKKRREITQNFQGNSIWNKRLKGGEGLLVPMNEHNTFLLQKLKDKYAIDGISESMSRTSISEDRKNTSSSSYNNFKDVELKLNENMKRKNQERELSKYSSDSRDNRKKKRYYSDSSEDSDDSEEERNTRKYRRSKDNYSDSSDRDVSHSHSDSHSHSESDYSSDSSHSESETDHGSKQYKRSEYKSNYSRESDTMSESDDHSSSSESDSSEDERIQYSIRKRNDNRHKGEELNSEIYSDDEDVVTLSRRLRYCVRKIQDLENSFKKIRL